MSMEVMSGLGVHYLVVCAGSRFSAGRPYPPHSVQSGLPLSVRSDQMLVFSAIHARQWLISCLHRHMPSSLQR